MRYLPVCILLLPLCLSTTSIAMAVAILCIATFWMVICATQTSTPFISYVSHVVDPFTDFMVGPDMEGPFDPNNPPNADGGDFDYE